MLSPSTRVFWPLPTVPVCCLAVANAMVEPAPTRGFEVDTSDRNNVVAFYHAIYLASEGYRNRMDWTGTYTSTAAGAEGNISANFEGDVERRLNYYRALGGIPANARVNTAATVRIQTSDSWKPASTTRKSSAAQRSALMIARNYPGSGGLSHNPAKNNVAWTEAAWNANKNGNLAIGFLGPGAVDAYMREDVPGVSGWNVDVGHRRWMMSLHSTDFASGDTPGRFSGNSALPPSNAFYVVPKQEEATVAAGPVFHSYPSEGYFPATHNSPYWSLSRPGANFASATVTVRDAGMNVVPVTVVSRRVGYGDNAIVWQVPSSVSARSVSADTTYQVTVSGIQGTGVPAEHAYQVTLINPGNLGRTGSVTGKSEPSLGGATYRISGLDGVDEVEAGTFLRRPADWSEGAEDGRIPRIISNTSGNYLLLSITSGFARTGSKSFRLTFPTRYDPFVNGVPEQSFELDREILPGAGTSLVFHYRRGLMTPASKLAVERSDNGGSSWTPITTLSGQNGGGDTSFRAVSLPLAGDGGSPVRVRFRYFLSDTTSALYAHEDYPLLATGIFIDDISVNGGDWLEPGGTVRAEGLSEFRFDSAVAGTVLAPGQTWWLRARAYLGGSAFPWGAPLVVRPSEVVISGFAAYYAGIDPDGIPEFEGDADMNGISDGLDYAFAAGTDGEAAGTPRPVDTVEVQGDFFEISRQLPAVKEDIEYGAEWSADLQHWSREGVAIRIEDGSIIARIPREGPSRMMRWVVWEK